MPLKNSPRTVQPQLQYHFTIVDDHEHTIFFIVRALSERFPKSLITAFHDGIEALGYPLLFATISGAHLYGFPSPDSDFDLRGAHVLPLDAVAGLDFRHETVEDSRVIEGLEMDIVSHDARKFFGLLLKKNGYVLEQLFSPLIVRTTPEHEELKKIAAGCITKHHSHHYFGFAETQTE